MGSSWLNAVGVYSVDGNRGVSFNRVSLALDAAVDSQGVLLSLEQLASNDLMKGSLIIPFEHKVELAQAYYVISLKQAANSEHITAFKQWLMHEVETDSVTV